MFRQTRYSAPNGRGKKGLKMSTGPFSYNTNPDSVSPEKLQQVIRTQEGDYPRPSMERGGSMAARNQMADRGIKRYQGDKAHYGLARLRDFFLAAGGIIDRPYSLSSVPFGKSAYSFADGGSPWRMTDDTPSSRPGYRTRTFSNSAALPEPDYSGAVSRGDWLNNTGAFADPRFDFSLNQARSYFEGNPNATGVRLGRERALATGESMGVNPAYPLTNRYDEYRESPVTSPVARLLNLPGVGPHNFILPSPERAVTEAARRPSYNPSRLIHTPEGFDYKHNRPAPGSITMRQSGGTIDPPGPFIPKSDVTRRASTRALSFSKPEISANTINDVKRRIASDPLDRAQGEWQYFDKSPGGLSLAGELEAAAWEERVRDIRRFSRMHPKKAENMEELEKSMKEYQKYGATTMKKTEQGFVDKKIDWFRKKGVDISKNHNIVAPYMVPGVDVMGGYEPERTYKKGGWIAKAVSPSHKGWCTPLSKSTCTGRRRAFALTMKKHHGFHKKEDGGTLPVMATGGSLAAIRKKPGGSNVGKKKFSDGSKRRGPYVGPSGGSPAGSYPIPDRKHALAALALAHHAPNPAGIKAAVHRKFPNIGKGKKTKKCMGGSMRFSKASH